ncbi:MAG: hypothetical protein JHC74_11020, partial [Thermoleophilia bacterium]|nr:hypothetical protein [Thermoleophilia bacterium]
MSRLTRWPLALCAAGLVLSAVPANAAVVVPAGGFVGHGTTAQVKEGIDVAHDAGARWVSLSQSWESLEPQPDSYLTPGGAGTATWDALGERLAYAKAKGMSVELRFANAPQWASGRAGSDDPPTPANVPAYGQFLSDLAQRFGPLLDAYSPWNEPNLTRFWNPVSPEAYTALQKVAYTSIKAVDPSATVLTAAIVGRYSGQNSGYSFLRRSYQAGLKGHADVIGWNGYPGGEPESDGPLESGVPAANTLPAQLYLRTLIDEFDPGRRVWIMETGWSTCVSCNVSAANGVTEAQQADYLTRAFTYRRRYLTGITDRIFWYQLRDEGTDRSDWFQNQGVVRADLSPKPALAAFRALGTDIPEPGAPGTGSPAATPAAASAVLPPAAARLGLPTTATSAKGRVVLGKPRLTARRGIFTLVVKVAVRGG